MNVNQFLHLKMTPVSSLKIGKALAKAEQIAHKLIIKALNFKNTHPTQ